MQTLFEIEMQAGENIFNLEGTDALDVNTEVISYDGWNIKLETTVSIFDKEFKVKTSQSHLCQKDYDRIIKKDELWHFSDMASADIKGLEVSDELANRLLQLLTN